MSDTITAKAGVPTPTNVDAAVGLLRALAAPGGWVSVWRVQHEGDIQIGVLRGGNTANPCGWLTQAVYRQLVDQQIVGADVAIPTGAWRVHHFQVRKVRRDLAVLPDDLATPVRVSGDQEPPWPLPVSAYGCQSCGRYGTLAFDASGPRLVLACSGCGWRREGVTPLESGRPVDVGGVNE